MATVIFNQPADMVNATVWSRVLYYSANTSTIIITDYSGNFIVYGGSFNYNTNGDLISGTVTTYDSYNYYLATTPAFTVRDITLNVFSVLNIAMAGNFIGIYQYGALSGNDTITGSVNGDTLAGYAGNDTISGGTGNDTFVFEASGNGIDTLADFASGDIIRINSAAFASAIIAGDGSNVGANQVQLASSGGTTTLYIGTDATAGADVTIILNGTYTAGQLAAQGSNIVLGAVVPIVVTITDSLPGIANRATGNVIYSLAFSEPVTGLEANDFNVTNGTVSSVSGTGNVWTVNVTPALGVTSVIGLTLKADAVSNVANNLNVLVSNTSQALDTIAPVAPKLVTNAAFNFLIDPQVTLQTSMGTIVLELSPEQAPITVANMLAYVNSGFYDSTLFHRVISGFMAQGGGFNAGLVTKTPTYGAITLESNNGLSNLRGTIAMARTDPNSATSQFFINQVNNDAGLNNLNYRSATSPGYAVFGHVLSGLAVIDSMVIVPTATVGANANVPVTDITITSFQQTLAGSSITNAATLAVSGLEFGASWSYSLDSGNNWTAGTGTSLVVPVGSYAANAIQVKQTDAVGNVSASAGLLTSALVVEITPPTVTAFSPADVAMGITIGSDITLTFSEAIQRGIGSIILKTAAGATVASYDAATSANLSITGSTLTINPSADLSTGTHYFVEFVAGSIKDLAGNSFAGTTSYDFTTNSSPALTDAKAALIAGTEDTAYTLTQASLLTGFTDIDGNTLTVTNLTASNGILSAFNATNGSWTFTPTANYNGIVNLNYGVSDGIAAAVAATQSFTLTPIPDITATASTATLNEGGASSTGTFTINLDSPAPTGGLTVNYTLLGTANLGLSAGNGVDYTLTAGSNITTLNQPASTTHTGSFTIAAGTTTATLNINALTDAVNDPSEKVGLKLLTGTSYQLAQGNTATTFASAASYSTGITHSNPTAITTGDFNGDGQLDLAFSHYTNQVSVLMRNAANTGFDTPVDYWTGGANALSLSTGDFNGDGKLDLAVANLNQNTVSVLLRNTSNTGFNGYSDVSTGTMPGDVRVGDFNGDGKADLLVTNKLDGTVSVLLNNTVTNATSISFAAKADYTVGTTPESVSVGDFNNDGKLDLAVANYGNNTVSILLNTTASNASSTSFASKVDYATGTKPASITMGDFNGDGKLDLAVANTGSNTVSVLLRNTANTGFDTKLDYNVGTAPNTVSVGDFNNDGMLDLAVANFSSNNLSVLLRNASNTGFDAISQYLAVQAPTAMGLGDFNHDGTTDIAAIGYYSHDVSVLLNDYQVMAELVIG